MLLSAVIIILQEVLEAALLVSVLLAITHILKMPMRWLAYAFSLGLCGAFLYQLNLETISSAFDYVGQEVSNATMQTAVYACLALAVFFLDYASSATWQKNMGICMAMALGLSIVREGSEIFIYIGSFVQQEEDLLSACLGGIIGTAIGTSLAALIYYTLVSINRSSALITARLLLALVAAAMLSQAVQLLVQADWLPSHAPLWDSSALLSEESLPGHLLYAIAGYEATPGLLQLLAYLFALASILAMPGLRPSRRVTHHA